MPLHTLQNEYWQVGILPETGASIAFGRVRVGGAWLDILRPTAEADYGNASLCSSFIMLPWANRLRDARFRFGGVDYQLQPSSADGTAIHGTVRRLAWNLESADEERIITTFDSATFAPDAINFPFKFTARAEFLLDQGDFVATVTLTNTDTQPFPAGFGHHPYFVRDSENAVQLQIPCAERWELTNALASAPPTPLPPEKDFRVQRPLGNAVYEDLLTRRTSESIAARLVYPQAAIRMLADPMFQHVLLFAPAGKPFFAVEPQSNANDGFNLHDRGIENGVFILQPGESKTGTIVLRIEEAS
jgi:aldose 1-epimerase